MPHRPVPLWYVLAAVMVSMLLTSVAGVIYTSHVQRQSEQRWCGLIAVLAGGPAPETERGRAIASAMEQLRQDFNC